MTNTEKIAGIKEIIKKVEAGIESIDRGEGGYINWYKVMQDIEKVIDDGE